MLYCKIWHVETSGVHGSRYVHFFLFYIRDINGAVVIDVHNKITISITSWEIFVPKDVYFFTLPKDTPFNRKICNGTSYLQSILKLLQEIPVNFIRNKHP